MSNLSKTKKHLCPCEEPYKGFHYYKEGEEKTIIYKIQRDLRENAYQISHLKTSLNDLPEKLSDVQLRLDTLEKDIAARAEVGLSFMQRLKRRLRI